MTLKHLFWFNKVINIENLFFTKTIYNFIRIHL
jgi:hypothetical protein